MSKLDIAWDNICRKYGVIEEIRQHGICKISATQIKRFAEPRLMTKFDNSSQLPRIFKDNNLSILPITRGDYIISDILTFEHLPNNPDVPIIDIVTPSNIESLDFSAITSEAIAINCAYITSILSDFTQEESLLPTVSGRMKSDTFGFSIRSLSNGTININVCNSQIEIDGGYEGDNSLSIIEAKNSICSEFMIRQLYYPYRKWGNIITKQVRPIFLEYSNGIFHLREYTFSNPNDYNSLSLLSEKKYRLRDSVTPITTGTIWNLLSETQTTTEPENIPFPQADSFERVVSLCEIIYNTDEDSLTKEILNHDIDFTAQSNFTLRQVDYYTNAGLYLGLVEKVRGESPTCFRLSIIGREIFATRSISERQKKLIKSIISHQAFARVLRLTLERGFLPRKDDVVNIMKDCHLSGFGTEEMYRRRASTVSSWVRWVLGTINE